MTGQTILETVWDDRDHHEHGPIPSTAVSLDRSGLPLPSVQLRLIDDQMKEIQEDQRIGEVCVRGPNVFGGYWRDPEATSKAFLGDWLRTGDAGYRDGKRFLPPGGPAQRGPDQIRAATASAPGEVEDVLESVTRESAEVAVVGLPRPRTWERRWRRL